MRVLLQVVFWGTIQLNAIHVNRFQRQLVVCTFLVSTAMALAEGPAAVSGRVRDHNGAPLPGALVEILGARHFPTSTAFTDRNGYYAFVHVSPGQYRIYAALAFYLPAHHTNVLIHSGSHAVVNLTMTTLLDGAQWFPAQPRPASEPADQWKWTLRSAANRPILRWLDATNGEDASRDADPSNATGSSRESAADQPRRRFLSRAQINLAVLQGSLNFGQGGQLLKAFVHVDHSGTLESSYRVQVAPNGGTTALMAGFEEDPAPDMALRTAVAYQTLEILAQPGNTRLQSFGLRAGDQISLGELLLAQLGAETNLIQSSQTLTTVRPYLSVDLHPNPATQISYRLATAADAQGWTDFSPSTVAVPQMANLDGTLRMTRALHQELALQHPFHGTQLQAAVFFDHVFDPVVNGYGDFSATEFAAGNVLKDPETGAFRSIGSSYDGTGGRVAASRQLTNSLWTAFEYTDGPALVLPLASEPQNTVMRTVLSGMKRGRAQSVFLSMHGTLPEKTTWTAGYRWQPAAAMTPVDTFNIGLNQPFFSVTLRQPLLSSSAASSGDADAAPDRLDLLLEMQNILAQGYRSVYLMDGNGVFFAPSARAMEGGLTFSF